MLAAPLRAKAAGKRLLIFTQGSRGDIQPFVALAGALQDAGFVVRLCTNLNGVPFAENFGVSALGVHCDAEAFCHEPEVKKSIESGSVYGFVKFFAQKNQERFPQALAMQIEEVRHFKPDALLTAFLDAAQARAIGWTFNVPVVHLWVQPGVYPTGEGVTILGEPAWLPAGIHRLFWHVLSAVGFSVDKSSKYEELKKQLPGCEEYLPQSLHEYMLDRMHPIERQVMGFPQELYRRPSDWPQDLQLDLTGFWVVGSGQQEQRMKDGDSSFGGQSCDALKQFLAIGDRPVYMGWGSMVAGSPERMALLAVRALMMTGLRAVVLGGWAALGLDRLTGQPDSEQLLEYAKANILFVASAPHEWLFPQCAALVYHGGAGTLAAAVRSGVPSIVTPCAFDQFDNARLLEVHGVGIATPHFSKVTAADLALALRRATADVELCKRAAQLGEQLRAQDGLAAAVRSLDNFFSEEVATNQWSQKVAKRKAELAALRSRQARLGSKVLGFFAWIVRLTCSSTPFDFSVKVR